MISIGFGVTLWVLGVIIGLCLGQIKFNAYLYGQRKEADIKIAERAERAKEKGQW